MAESQNKTMIRNKLVLHSEPFLPDKKNFTGFVGRENELRMITAAWLAGDFSLPMNPVLVGEPGVGKNRLIYELAMKTGRTLYIFQGHEDITSEDLACTVRFSDQSRSKLEYVVSPLVTAMINGGICFIDEIGKIRPRALALLVSVLDERRYIDSTLLGERIYAHPAFRFVAATNTSDLPLLPEFMSSRLRPQIKFGYPGKEDIDKIIHEFCKGTKIEVNYLLNNFWILWNEFGGRNGSVSPRDAIYVFAWASKLGSFDNNGGIKTLLESGAEKPYELHSPVNYTGIKIDHLRQAFEKLFTDRKEENEK